MRAVRCIVGQRQRFYAVPCNPNCWYLCGGPERGVNRSRRVLPRASFASCSSMSKLCWQCSFCWKVYTAVGQTMSLSLRTFQSCSSVAYNFPSLCHCLSNWGSLVNCSPKKVVATLHEQALNVQMLQLSFSYGQIFAGVPILTFSC